MIVYVIRHRASGLAYVGRTRGPLARRWSTHVAAAPRRPDMPISVAITTHGPEAFDVEELERYDDEAAWRRGEVEWTERLRTQAPNGLNVRVGDQWTDEMRAKVSAALTGREITWGDKISEAQRGHTSSPAQLAALAAGRAIGPSSEVLSANNRHRKLADDDVREVRRLAAAGELSHREIGERFGVQQSAISKIVRGTSLAHVPQEPA